MQSVLKENKFLLPSVAGLLIATIIITFSDYFIYFVPVVLVLSIFIIFAERLKEKFHLVIWSLLLLSLFLGGSREQEAILQQTLDPLRVLRIMVFMLLFSIIIFGFLLNKFQGIKEALKSPLGWFLLYGLFAMLSAFYSDQFFISLWKGFEVVACITISIYLYLRLQSYRDVKQFWTLNIAFLFLLVCSSYIGIIITPSEALKEIRGGAMVTLEGVYPTINSNSLTQMTAIIIIVYFIRHIYSSKIKLNYLAVIVFTFPALILSYGRTSILALFISLVILLALNKNYLYLSVLGLIAAVIVWTDGYSYVMLFLDKGGTLDTMSGRLYYWPNVWDLFIESPIFGYGFYVGARVIFAEKVNIESFATTDNTYFDVLLSVGILGFIPFALMLYSFIKKIFRKGFFLNNKDIIRFRFELVFVAFIILFRSLTGPSFQILHWNLILFLSVIICLQSLEKYENSTNSQSS